MATTDDLIISIRADIDNVTAQLNRIDNQLNNTQQAAQNTGDSMSDAFAGAVAGAGQLAAAIGAGTAALAVLVATTSNAVREFNSLANSLGLSYQQLQRMEAVSGAANLETEMMIDLAKTLSEKMGEGAAGNEDFLKTIDAIGLSFDDLQGMTVDQQLLAVSDALGKVGDQGTKAVIGGTLFGDNWLSALKLTEIQAQQTADAFDATGRKLSDLDVSRLIEADKQFDKLIANSKMLANEISSNLSPVFSALAKEINDAFDVNPNEKYEPAISLMTDISIKFAGVLINVFTTVRGAVEIVVGSISALAINVVKPFTVAFFKLLEGVVGGITDIVNLGEKAYNIYAKIKGKDQVALSKNPFEGLSDSVLENINLAAGVAETMFDNGIQRFADGITGKADDEFVKLAEKFAITNSGVSTGGGDSNKPTKKGDSDKPTKKGDSDTSDNKTELKNINELAEAYKLYDELIAELTANEAARNEERMAKEDDARAKRQQAILDELSSIETAGLSELELLDRQHEARMEKLTELAEGEAILKQQIDDAKLTAEAQHQAKRADLILGTGNKIQELSKAFQKNALTGALQFFASDFGGFSQHSRKMFELQKAAKTAQVLIETPAAISSAYTAGAKVGPWTAAAYAAAAAAHQLSQLRAIQSASFGGGGGGAGSSAASGSTPSAAAAPPEQQPLQQRFVSIGIHGGDNAVFSKQQVRDLINRIGEEVRDGAVLRVQ